MKVEKRIKGPVIPAQRNKTIRKTIISILGGRILSAKDISSEARVPEKEVYDHMHHIQKTLSNSERALIVIPAECRKCGFVFRKRGRLNKPGKCPLCHSEAIKESLFSID